MAKVVDAGYVDTDISTSSMESAFSGEGIDATVHSVDGSRSGWGVGGGYQLTGQWAVELAYQNLDDVEVKYAVSSDAKNLGDAQPESGEGITLSAVYSYPLTDKFYLRGRLGVFDWESDYETFRDGNKIASDSISGTDLYWGLGVAYALSPQWSVNAEFQRFEFDRESSDYFRLGAAWLFQ